MRATGTVSRVRWIVVVAIAGAAFAACGSSGRAASSAGGKGGSTSVLGHPATRYEKTYARKSIALYAKVLSTIAQTQFVGGVWHPSYPAWRTGSELGDVAAIVSRTEPKGPFASWAIQTFDTMITQHQQPNGSFGPPAAGDQISTGAELVSLGTAYLELEPILSPAVKQAWQQSLQRAANWLLGRLYYYINGNVNLQESLGMYLAWRATRNAAFYRAYNRSWEFALVPGPKWPGYGIVYTKQPDGRFGKGGAAYLAEKGTGAPGFDPHYTILQADYVAELYALTGTPRVLRLLNLLVAQLLTRTDEQTLVIQTGGGSRETTPGVSTHLITASLPVLAFAHRSDLLALARKQFSVASSDFTYDASASIDEDQIMGNYAMSLLLLDPPPAASDAAKRAG